MPQARAWRSPAPAVPPACARGFPEDENCSGRRRAGPPPDGRPHCRRRRDTASSIRCAAPDRLPHIARRAWRYRKLPPPVRPSGRYPCPSASDQTSAASAHSAPGASGSADATRTRWAARQAVSSAHSASCSRPVARAYASPRPAARCSSPAPGSDRDRRRLTFPGTTGRSAGASRFRRSGSSAVPCPQPGQAMPPSWSGS